MTTESSFLLESAVPCISRGLLNSVANPPGYSVLIGWYTPRDNRSDSQAGFWKDCSFFGNAVDKNWHLAVPELIPYLCCICLGCVFLFGHNG